MLTTRRMSGLNVVLPGGQRIGTVQDTIIDYERREVIALTVRADTGQMALPYESIFDVADDRVVVTSPDDMVNIDRLPRVQAARRRSLPTGAPVRDERGCVLGWLSDIRFDAESGKFTCYELSGEAFTPGHVEGEPGEVSPVLVPAAQVVGCDGSAVIVNDTMAALLTCMHAGDAAQTQEETWD